MFIVHIRSNTVSTSISRSREPTDIYSDTDTDTHLDTYLEYNHNLIDKLMTNKVKIGHISNSHFILSCNDHKLTLNSNCILNPNMNYTDLYYIVKYATNNNYITILTVNTGYINMAINWLCWVQRIKFTNFIFLAEDSYSANYFQALNIPVIINPNGMHIKSDSVDLPSTRKFRTDYLNKILNFNYHFMIADFDGIWMENPYLYIDEHFDVTGQLHRENSLYGGLIIVRSTNEGKNFWKQIIKCKNSNIHLLRTHHITNASIHKYTEQFCINFIIETKKIIDLKVQLFDGLKFTGKRARIIINLYIYTYIC
jgi:hypothetical protein